MNSAVTSADANSSTFSFHEDKDTRYVEVIFMCITCYVTDIWL